MIVIRAVAGGKYIWPRSIALLRFPNLPVPPECGVLPQRVRFAHVSNQLANFRGHVWSARRRRDSRVQYKAKALRCQAITVSGHERCADYGANRATSREQDPQKPVGGLEAQTRQRVLLENGKLMTKREVLRLQGGTVSKAGGDQRQKSDEKKTHRDTTRIS
jgi:hypothetical protein